MSYTGLTGKVQSTAGVALAGATILLDTGAYTTSSSSGAFSFASVSTGQHAIQIARSGYKTASGVVTLQAGRTASVLVTLSPASSGSTKGTLNVAAYTYYSGGIRYPVYRIEVSESGNYAKRWSNTWYYDAGYPRTDLACTGANLGKYHNIKVTWRSGAREYSGTWTRMLSAGGQTETFYNP